MTRPQVTQKNVHLFIPHKVAKICGELNRSEHLSLNESILKMYNSPAYETLSRESSKLWQEGWITVMTTGRSGVINCGRFGTVELIHTAKPTEKIMPRLRLDARTGMWWADEELALQDMKDAKRDVGLVNGG